ncbi:MAG: hypothetical protein OEQ13_04005 [Acidobacteriota bacterium]|nr:hypothetical protein [Acidobacteriota bacterium]
MGRRRRKRRSPESRDEAPPASRTGPPPPTGGAPSAEAVDRLVIGCLAAVLIASVLIPVLLAGRPTMWSLPETLVPSAAVAGRALGVTAALVAALLMFAWAHRRVEVLAARGGLIAAVVIVLTATFFLLGPLTYIGDWQWMLWVTDDGKPLGKWYGASLMYGWFHRLINLVATTLPMTSIRLFSSLCGALTAYVWYRTVRTLGLTRHLPAWPFLYLSAFGVIGVGLSHAEIYAPVALLFCALLWSGIALLDEISPARVIVFALLSGIGLSFYATMLFVVPVVVLVLGWCAWTGARRGDGRVVVASACGLVLLVLPTIVAQVAGPEPIQGHLASFWVAKVKQEGVVGALPSAKHFHPDDVFWPVLAHFMNPKYLFAGWHLRDIGQHLLLDDRVGLVLAPVLLVFALVRGRPRPVLPARLAFLAGLSAVFGVYGFWLVNGKPYPWDWDLISYTVLPVNVLAAGLLAWLAEGRAYGRAMTALVVAAGVLSMASGVQFMSRYPDRPASFGVAQGSLSLGIVPPELTIRPGDPVHLWFWLKNDSDRTITVRPERLRFAVVAESAQHRVVMQAIPRRVWSGCHVPADGRECLKDLLFEPVAVQVEPSGASTQAPDGAEDAGTAPAGVYQAQIVVDLGRGDDGVARTLRSDVLRMTVVP